MNAQTRKAFQRSAIAVAVLAAWSPVQAAEVDEVTALLKPESTLNVGVGYVSSDNRQFGMYSGMNEEGLYGLLDVDLVNRDDATGTWSTFEGRNLGLPSREMRFEHGQQGNWGYFLDYSRIPRYEPYTVVTNTSGIGTDQLTINGGTGVPVEIGTVRDRFGLGFDKVLGKELDVQVRYRHEEKTGTRLYGRTGIDFLAEPIDSTTQIIEATLGYTGKRLQLSGGYYGGAYNNKPRALSVSGGAGTYNPIGLPPDNQSHQIFVAGGYSFSDTTRATFKAAYAHATQKDEFIGPALPGNQHLGGEVNTTQLQAGISARPMPKLSLLANLRYEDRDDKTPIFDYFTGSGTYYTGENEPRSIKTTAGKLEASYALPQNFRVTGGLDYDKKERNTSPYRVVSARDETEELSYRLALRRSMSETLTGSLAYIHSKRDGTDYLTTVTTADVPGSNLIAPINIADRDRDKVKLTLNWTPTDALTLQLVADSARDDYTARTDQDLGARKGKAENYALDATYTFSERWQATAWVSRNENHMDQSTITGGNQWVAALNSLGDSFGIGVRAKPTAKLELGADLQYMSFTDEFGQEYVSGAAIPVVPDIVTRIASAKLSANYALQKNSGVRVQYAHEKWKTDDWTWTSFTYAAADGTRLVQDPRQTVNFIGVSYYQRWW